MLGVACARMCVCVCVCVCAQDALSDVASPEGALDHVWVMGWLEDIGLPQYKPNFVANLVDGRMLNCLMLVRVGAG